ncbi:ABC transporter permease [Marinilabiliaceae bacterium JC040]|nr:ABC transporter permease [Marinilabiliaceae bacterium JC040]
MNNIKHIFRTIFRYKISSSLNIISLFIAFWGIIILALFISHEFSYDNFHKNKDDIYIFKLNNDQTNVCVGIKEIIQKNVPEIEKISNIEERKNLKVHKSGLSIKNSVICTGIIAQNDLLDILEYEFIEGNKTDVLKEPNTVIISNELRKKLFGNEKALGKTIKIGYGKAKKINGVYKKFTQNSSFNCDILIPFLLKNDWTEWSYSIIMKFKKNSDIDNAKSILLKHKRMVSILKDLEERGGFKNTISFMPLSKVHFCNSFKLPGENKININIIYVLITLLSLLAIMSAINFINFSTSQAPLRAKALAIQQIFGLKKWKTKLIIISESICLSLIALVISLILHISFYTQIQNIFEIKGLNINDRPIYYIVFIIFAIIFGIIAGLYPAKYITSPHPSQAVKGKTYFTNKGKFIRSTLIILQFTIVLSLLIISISIKKQINFWNNFDTGLKTENIVYATLTKNLRKHDKAFARELLKNNNIIDYTYTAFTPGQIYMNWGMKIKGKKVSFTVWPVDERFLNFFDIKIIKGRNFISEEADSKKFLANKKAVDTYNWNNISEIYIDDFNKKQGIVGVCNNFNFDNLKNPIKPMLFWFNSEIKNYILLKTNKCNYKELFSFIQKTAEKFDNENSINYNFLDTKLQKLYKEEEKTGTFIQFVALWTILLAITGLLGLIIFISRDRMKEISIRKVNGASTKEIIRLLNNVYLKWLGIAFVIAVPISYLCVKEWLSSYTYKTEISWWIFALAGAIVLIITICSTSYINYKAASVNPIKNLKDE